MPTLRAVFMGTPDFAIPSLRALINSDIEVSGVYTQPPRPAKRGHALTLSSIHSWVTQAKPDIPVYTPSTLKDPTEHQRIQSFQPDIIVVVAYGLLLPKAILESPRFGCLNVHASLLPRWRGASPIQYALLQGDLKTGITYMKMDKGLDTGEIIAQKELLIPSEATSQTLAHDLAHLGGTLLVSVLHDIVSGEAQYVPQPTTGVTYAEKLSKEEGHINWHRSAEQLERQIRAFHPWPGSFFRCGGSSIKILKAHIDPNLSLFDLPPGTAVPSLAPPLTIACGEGTLTLDQVQLPGKSPISAQDFIHGYRHLISERFP